MTSTARNISRITTALGALTLAGLTAVAALPAIGQLSSSGDALTGMSVSVDGVTHLEVDARRSSVTVRFEDVPEARIDSSATSSDWRWTSAGDTITASNSRPFANACFFWCGSTTETVTITLPSELQETISARVDASSGAVDIAGDYTHLALTVGAGAVTYAGTSPVLEVDVAAGKADIDAAGTDRARFTIAAGEVAATFTGTPPRDLAVDIAAGQATLTLPDTPYEVTSNVAFGTFDNRLHTAPDAPHTIDVEVAAGTLRLLPH